MSNDDAGGAYRYLATATWFLGMGWAIGIAIVLGVVLGNWLDGQTGRHPLFLLIGIMLGLATGLYTAVRMLMRYLAGQDS